MMRNIVTGETSSVDDSSPDFPPAPAPARADPGDPDWVRSPQPPRVQRDFGIVDDTGSALSARSGATSQVDVDTALEGLPLHSQVVMLQQRVWELNQRNSRFRSENTRLRAEQESMTERLRMTGGGVDFEMLNEERRELSLRRRECDELRTQVELLSDDLRRVENGPGDELDELRGLLEAEFAEDLRNCSDYYEARLQELRDRLEEKSADAERNRDIAESLENELQNMLESQSKRSRSMAIESNDYAPELNPAPYRSKREVRTVDHPIYGSIGYREDDAVVKRKRRRVKKGDGGSKGQCEMCTGCCVQ